MNQSAYAGKESINGTEVYFEHYMHESSQQTVVLLHGFLSSSFSFRRLIPILAKEFNVISVDLPPFGKSGKSRKYTYSYENTAKTVISLIEKLTSGTIYLIGHSMGGQICLNILLFRPELVDHVVLLCSSSYMLRLKPALIYSSYIPFFHFYIKKWLQRSGVENNLKNVVFDHSMIDEEMKNGYLAPFQKDDIFRALTRMIRDREGDLPREVLKQIKTPCLLIWGEHDKVVPLRIGKQLHKDLENSKLIVLKNTGHLVPEERPEDVLKYMKQFMMRQENTVFS